MLSYPVLVEPYLSNRSQAWIWSGAFVAFACCCIAVALTSRKGTVAAPELNEEAAAPEWGVRILWMLLAAAGSAMLLAITNHMTQNVAAIPFLWIVPLSMYLLTFILCFESHRWYSRTVFVPMFAAGLAALAWFITDAGNAGYGCILALVLISRIDALRCLHGVPRRTGADEARHLAPDGFYLTISVGGAVGGLFVAFFAPRVFNALYEMPILVGLSRG